MINLYIQSELNYDRFYKNSERIYRILQRSKTPSNDVVSARSGPPIGPTIKETFPEVENFTRILAGKNVMDSDPLVKNGDMSFLEPNLFYVDPAFFEVFTFETLDNNKIDFSDPYSMVITESTSQKYFGSQNAVGQTLEISGIGVYHITQVIRNIPANSHFHFDLAANFLSHPSSRNTDWGWHRVYTYVLLKENSSVPSLERRLNDLLNTALSGKSFGKVSYAEWRAAGNELQLIFQPLESIHLNSNNTYEFEPGGDHVYIRLFFVVSLMILLLACVNFINLSTAKAVNYSKEIGVKKTLGASKIQLLFQFFSQSIISCWLASVLALIITGIVLPFLNELVGHKIVMPEFRWYFLIIAASFVVLLAIISGAYPAFYLTHFQPAQVLKPGNQLGGQRSKTRNILIVFQFCISIGLIAATFTIFHQINYMKTIKRGFADNLLILDRAQVLGNKTETFKQLLMKSSTIESVSASSTVPGNWIGTVQIYPLSGTIADRIVINPIFVDCDFIQTYAIELAQGRSFSKNFPSDSSAVILNETALTMLGIKNIEGESVVGWLPFPHRIIGVMKDFNQKSAKNKIGPMILFGDIFSSLQNITIRFNTPISKTSIGVVQQAWNSLVPSEPMIYSFLDDNFNRLYKTEENTGNLLSLFSLLTLLIAGMGLFGLVAFSVEQRSKEFAIRKVFGADASVIFILLGKEFGTLILTALVIAIPIVIALMNQWLNNFAYRSPVPIWPLAMAGCIAFLAMTLAVFPQALSIAFELPIKKLKTD